MTLTFELILSHVMIQYLVVVVQGRCAIERGRCWDVLRRRGYMSATDQLEAGLVYADITGVIRTLPGL